MHMQEFGIVLTCGTTEGQRVLQRRALRVLDLECLVSRQCLCEGVSPLLARLGFYLLNLIASLIAKFAEPVLRRLAVQLYFEWRLAVQVLVMLGFIVRASSRRRQISFSVATFVGMCLAMQGLKPCVACASLDCVVKSASMRSLC